MQSFSNAACGLALRIKDDNKVMNLLAKDYSVATVLQYIFTFVTLSAVIKGMITAAITLIISLGLVIVLKKVPAVGLVFGKTFNHKYGRRLITLTLTMILLLITL